MTRRRLNRIRLDKIAAVDQPCQQHATVGIVKRAVAPSAIHKATFDETLQAQLVADRVSEAFYRAFDGLWQRNNAFREALTDDLASGGDGQTVSDDYLASVRSLVETAVEAARNVGTDPTDANIEKAMEEALIAKFSPEEKIMKIIDKAGLAAAIKAFDPKAATAKADAAVIKAAAKTLDAEDSLPKSGMLAKAAPEDPAPDPEIAKLRTEVAILKLAPVAKVYFDGLDESGQTAFLAKSAAEQNADVEKANATDPVLHKCKDGTEIRKSDGATMLALAKANDALTERVEKAEGNNDAVTFEKRAATEFPHVAEATAVSLLKSARQVGLDTDGGKAIVASLAAMEKSAAPGFERVGSSGSGPAVPQGIKKARETFAAKVDSIAARDKIAKHVAMEKAEVEEPELFAEAYPPAEPAEAAAE